MVDRFKVRPDLKLRLAESFETAIRLSDGVARIVPMVDSDRPGSDRQESEKDTIDAEELIFSSRFACHQCGYSLNELEPRIFSFNNPAGACPGCDGLGVEQFFDPARVVQHEELTLPGGAIRGWDRRNAYYFQLIKSLASHYEFKIDTPFRDLSDEIQNVILYGSGDEEINFKYLSDRKGAVKRRHAFEGVIPNMRRRYHETDSAMVREQLVKYMNSRPCPECHGTRLNTAARHVYVNEYTLPDITAMPVDTARKRFQN